MSEELDALVEKVTRAIEQATVTAPTGKAFGPTIALAAIRAVAEATREPSETMEKKGHLALAGWISPAMHSCDAWRAMHAASPLGEALRDE